MAHGAPMGAPSRHAAGWTQRRPVLGPRLPRRTPRARVRCWATIPVPDSQPFLTDLGWPADFAQHYVKGKLIGQGSFGSVYLGIDLHTGKEVAIKVMPKQRGKLTKERTLQKLAKEVGILQKMQACRNTVRLLGCYEAADEVMVVTGLCSGGDLQKLSDDHGALPERAVALIAYEVLQVVEKCHELGILHGDLKPANFVLSDRTRNPLFSKDINLLFGPPWLLAIDFGCSQYLGSARFTKRTGTPVYMAPEIFERDYHWEADMWSLGIMLYQLYARRFPYWSTYEECRHAKLDEVAVLVAESPLPLDYGVWRGMSAEGIDFMRGCLERDYSQRMTVTQALNHPWLMQWLPEEDYGSLDGAGSLDSLGTSSDDEEIFLAHSYNMPAPQLQQQPQPQPQQQQPAAQPSRVRRQHLQQHGGAGQAQAQPELAAHLQHMLQQQQQQQQGAASQRVVVLPGQLGSQDHSGGLGQAPGAYSSSSSVGAPGSDGHSAPPPPPQQQQQHAGRLAPQQQQHAGSTGGQGGEANNVVPNAAAAAPASSRQAGGQQ